MTSPSSHRSVPRSSPLNIPAGARATIESRVLAGEATAAEVLHFVFGASSDPTLVGLAHRPADLFEHLEETLSQEVIPVSAQEVAGIGARLARVLVAEVNKLDLDGEGGK